MAEIPNSPRCQHIMDSGNRCGSPALHDRPLCYWHQRARNGCKRPQPYSIILEDYNTIQIAVTNVFNDLMAQKITPQHANSAFYGLSLAQRYCEKVRGTFMGEVETEPTPIALPLVADEAEPCSADARVREGQPPAVREQAPSPAQASEARAALCSADTMGLCSADAPVRAKAHTTTTSDCHPDAERSEVEETLPDHNCPRSTAAAPTCHGEPEANHPISALINYNAPGHSHLGPKLSDHDVKLLRRIVRKGPKFTGFHAAARLLDAHISSKSSA